MWRGDVKTWGKRALNGASVSCLKPVEPGRPVGLFVNHRVHVGCKSAVLLVGLDVVKAKRLPARSFYKAAWRGALMWSNVVVVR